MQSELAGEPLQISAVNSYGREAQVPTMAALGPLPILQDEAEVDVWARWAVTYRDVVILDRENQRVAVYNLTAHDLGVAENYAALKKLITDAL